MIKEIKASLKKSLQESVDQLINEMFNLVNPESLLHDDLIIIAGRFKQLERDFSRGSLDQDMKEKSLAQIRVGLLKVINDLEEKDLASISKAEILTPLQMQNEAFRELFIKYQNAKKWIEENFGEFDHSFSDNENQKKEWKDEKPIRDVYENSTCRIFGSHLKINFTHCYKIRFEPLSEAEKGFVLEEKHVCQYILDVLDLDEVFHVDEFRQGDFGGNLYSVTLICQNGLKKIFASEFTEEAVNVSGDKADNRDNLDYKGEIQDYKRNAISLHSTTLKFLEAFCEKMNEFVEICRKLVSVKE